MSIAIEIKNISKKYRIDNATKGYIALRDVLMNVIRKPIAFLGNKFKRAVGASSVQQDFWALKDVSFNVEKGEILGIIGHNGAGKSTLLKILSEITPPTEGEIVINGRIGSLLEVGTGFHLEMSGRENIFMNGAIIGMKRSEIIEKFDEIVEFSGVAKFLDTPIKHYSSGMIVRLAFAVAANMNHDILLIDEVLAVGDEEFQKKCIGKMEDLSSAGGRTIVFISHDLEAVRQLCPRCVLMDKGQVKMIGETSNVINAYHELLSQCTAQSA